MNRSGRSKIPWVAAVIFSIFLLGLVFLERTPFRKPSNIQAEARMDAAQSKLLDQADQVRVKESPEVKEEIGEEILEVLFSAEKEPEFLETNYESVSKWLDERFKVDFTDVSPTFILDQPPLSDIYYEIGVDVLVSEIGSLKASDISRRELLSKICEQWGLKMEYGYNDRGIPTEVRVNLR
jgi:hypothetical protein